MICQLGVPRDFPSLSNQGSWISKRSKSSGLAWLRCYVMIFVCSVAKF